MKWNKGKIIIIIGILFVGYAGYLLVQNQLQENQAATFSAEIVEELSEILEEISIDDDDEEGIQDQNIEDNSAQGGDTILIDNNEYIGILEIPSLNLELPIQSEWSYSNLRNSPCVYVSNPMIIAAHNYNAHFGRIYLLEVGDQVCFTDINNVSTYYEVVLVEMLGESDVEEMINDDYDLTLFTCNYNNNTQRVSVRLQKIS